MIMSTTMIMTTTIYARGFGIGVYTATSRPGKWNRRQRLSSSVRRAQSVRSTSATVVAASVDVGKRSPTLKTWTTPCMVPLNVLPSFSAIIPAGRSLVVLDDPEAQVFTNVEMPEEPRNSMTSNIDGTLRGGNTDFLSE